MKPKCKVDIQKNFDYHPPTEDKICKYEQLRITAMEYMVLIDQLCPESREKSLAMTKIEEAVMWANASIARNE